VAQPDLVAAGGSEQVAPFEVAIFGTELSATPIPAPCGVREQTRPSARLAVFHSTLSPPAQGSLAI
jgi:hypothetical protein